jgi:hypothetical protein
MLSRFGRRSTFCLAVAVAGCTDVVEPPVALFIEAVTPTEVAGTIREAAIPKPVVRVTDVAGAPVAGAKVFFRGGPSIAFPTAETDADGLASGGTWTLGSQAGRTTMSAQVAWGGRVLFFATSEPGPVGEIYITWGNGQTGTIGSELPLSLRVLVTDSFENGIAGVPVTFTVISGGGSIDGEPVLTGSSGVAVSSSWTLGPEPGTQQVRISAGTVESVAEALAVED